MESGEMPVSGTRLAASAVAGVAACGLELADDATETAELAEDGDDVGMIVREAKATDDVTGTGSEVSAGERQSGRPERHRRRSIGREAKPT